MISLEDFFLSDVLRFNRPKVTYITEISYSTVHAVRSGGALCRVMAHLKLTLIFPSHWLRDMSTNFDVDCSCFGLLTNILLPQHISSICTFLCIFGGITNICHDYADFRYAQRNIPVRCPRPVLGLYVVRICLSSGECICFDGVWSSIPPHAICWTQKM